MFIDVEYLALAFFIIFFGIVLICIYWSHDKVTLGDIEESIYKANKETGFIEKVEKKDEESARELANASYHGKIKHDKKLNRK